MAANSELRALIIEQGMTQKEISDFYGWKPQFFAHWIQYELADCEKERVRKAIMDCAEAKRKERERTAV